MIELSVVVDFISQSWFGACIGILGILIAVYQFYQKTTAVPMFQYFGQKLISNENNIIPNEVSIYYAKNKVNRLSVTYIAFWNDGRGAIRIGDIVPADPLLFSFQDGIILRAEVINSTRPSIDANIAVSNNEMCKLAVSFSFLDSKDGFLIKILHTSNSIKPKFSGTIIGIPAGVKNCGKYPYYQYFSANENKEDLIYRILYKIARPDFVKVFILLGFGMSALILSFLPSENQIYLIRGDIDIFITRILLQITSVVYFYMAYIMYSIVRRRFPIKLD